MLETCASLCGHLEREAERGKRKLLSELSAAARCQVFHTALVFDAYLVWLTAKLVFQPATETAKETEREREYVSVSSSSEIKTHH